MNMMFYEIAALIAVFQMEIFSVVFVYWKKLLIFLIGRGIWSLVSWTFDNLIYALAIAYLGSVLGGILMTIASMFICMGMVIYHRNKKVGWIGWDEVVGLLKEREDEFVRIYNLMTQETSLAYFFIFIVACNQNKVISLMIVVVLLIVFKIFIAAMQNRKLEDFIAFIALSIFEDPFITTVYLRHGNISDLKRKDWLVLFSSILLGNAYWIARTTLLVQLAKYWYGKF